MENPSRRRVLQAIAAAPFVKRGRYALFAQSKTEFSDRAIRLVRESLVIDMLNQFLYRADLQPRLRQWLSKPGAFTEADCQRYLDSGITAINFGNGANTYEDTIRLFADWNSFLAQYPDRLLRIGSAADFARAKSSRRYGIIFGLQNAAHFRRPDDVDTSMAWASASHSSPTTSATWWATGRSNLMTTASASSALRSWSA